MQILVSSAGVWNGFNQNGTFLAKNPEKNLRLVLMHHIQLIKTITSPWHSSAVATISSLGSVAFFVLRGLCNLLLFNTVTPTGATLSRITNVAYGVVPGCSNVLSCCVTASFMPRCLGHDRGYVMWLLLGATSPSHNPLIIARSISTWWWKRTVLSKIFRFDVLL